MTWLKVPSELKNETQRTGIRDEEVEAELMIVLVKKQKLVFGCSRVVGCHNGGCCRRQECLGLRWNEAKSSARIRSNGKVWLYGSARRRPR